MTSSVGRQLIVLEMNEVNLDLARRYLGDVSLPGFERLFSTMLRRTTAEGRYEDLEPWIQWVSAHTGLTAAEHGVFRLGDMVHCPAPQYFEALEAAGVSVGAVSPMNTVNRLKAPAYFVPDPWTRTEPDKSFWSRALAQAVGQAVNDNAQQKITPRSLIFLALALVRFAQPKHYGLYLKLALTSRQRSWRRALFLDLLLHDLHMGFWRRRKPGFSSVFLNAGAHIQHHYMFASRAGAGLSNPAWYLPAGEDPFLDMLKVYDRVLTELFATNDASLIVATGLTQQPYERTEFYWRLQNHAEFLARLGLGDGRVAPRMTRDFLIEFDTAERAVEAEGVLRSVKSVTDGLPVFDEVDNRGASLFVTLTYPGDVSGGLEVQVGNGAAFDLAPHVVFVALKNGKHDGRGFIAYRGDVARLAAPDGAHVKTLHDVVLCYFGVQGAAGARAREVAAAE